MKIVTVDIKNEVALSLLRNLESMHVLRVVEQKTVPEKRKLSERFAGCLSEERTEELQRELIQIRADGQGRHDESYSSLKSPIDNGNYR